MLTSPIAGWLLAEPAAAAAKARMIAHGFNNRMAFPLSTIKNV